MSADPKAQTSPPADPAVSGSVQRRCSAGLTDVESQLRRMSFRLGRDGVRDAALVLDLAADIVSGAGRKQAALEAVWAAWTEGADLFWARDLVRREVLPNPERSDRP